MVVELGVARTDGQVGGWFLEVTRNEEVRGIPTKIVSVLFVVGRDWTHHKDYWASRWVISVSNSK